MEDYKQYLTNDADETEQRAAEQVMEGLEGLTLEAKLKEVAAERQVLERRAKWQRIFVWTIALALIAGAIYFVWGNQKTPDAPPPVPPKQEQPATPPADEPTPPVDKPVEQQRPMAQLSPGERLPNPRYPAPDVTMIRGDGPDNKAQKALLDQVWYTDYPLKGLKAGGLLAKADENLKKRDFTGAYLELERLGSTTAANDTLRYLKGYCLLEMGEGAEALAIFDGLQGRHSTWEPQMQWYRGLAMLLSSEREKALTLLQQVAKQPRHPYQRQASKAVGLIKK